jgi:hypothetical protein
MIAFMRNFLVGFLALLVLGFPPASAQAPIGEAYSQEALDQLLAPIALYPDQLLTQILIAATHPMDVVEAADFVQRNPHLNVEILDQVLAEKNWDPSVKSLTAFPQVLAMMNDHFDWMQRLGNAFLADQPRVMDTVQALRWKAQTAGNLQPTPEQSVIVQDNQIIIEPMRPDIVYVPLYNPMLVYGPWWAPNYPPWFWYPPPIYGYPPGTVISTGIIFGTAWSVSQNHWHWARPSWHERRIRLNTVNNRFWNRPGLPETPHPIPDGTRQHGPEHSNKGAATPTATTRERTLRVEPGAVPGHRDLHGREPALPVKDTSKPRPEVKHTAPTVVPVAPAPSVAVPAASATPHPERTHQRPASPPHDPDVTPQQRTQIRTEHVRESRQPKGEEAEARQHRSPATAEPRQDDHQH